MPLGSGCLSAFPAHKPSRQETQKFKVILSYSEFQASLCCVMMEHVSNKLKLQKKSLRGSHGCIYSSSARMKDAQMGWYCISWFWLLNTEMVLGCPLEGEGESLPLKTPCASDQLLSFSHWLNTMHTRPRGSWAGTDLNASALRTSFRGTRRSHSSLQRTEATDSLPQLWSL